jgi:hypothetical protein
MTIKNQAVYGASNVLRDHYGEFYETLGERELLRCKIYCAPVIEVESMLDMATHLASIPARGDGKIVLRGQPSLYKLDRPSLVKRFLFGESCSEEPSLPTAAVRKKFDYDSLHFALQYFTQEQVLGRNATTKKRRDDFYRRWRKKVVSPDCSMDYALMALAQHYGIPTDGLDVTTSLDVAVWFATNRFTASSSGVCNYSTMKQADWATDREKWPVVFVCQVVNNSLSMSLQDCKELDGFGLRALRPQRQRALFFHGGQGDHQNRLAEAVVCMFRLRPGNYATRSKFDYLFPSPKEDPAYKHLLKFASVDQFAALGATHVTNFHSATP